MYRSRPRLPSELDGLLLDDLKAVIVQANLGETDTLIAQKYLIGQIPQIDIADMIGMHRTTVSKRIKYIVERARQTAIKLNLS